MKFATLGESTDKAENVAPYATKRWLQDGPINEHPRDAVALSRRSHRFHGGLSALKGLLQARMNHGKRVHLEPMKPWDIVAGLNIAFLSHTPATAVFRVGSHHLAHNLACQDNSVVHVSTPISLLHLVRLSDADHRRRMRLAARGLDRTTDGVWHLVPRAALPLGLPRMPLAEFSRRSCGRYVAKAVRSRAMPTIDVALVDQPLFSGILEYLEPRRVVYRPTDIHGEGVLASAQQAVLPMADAVVATSEVVLAKLHAPVHRMPTLVLENGVEFARFAGRGAKNRPAAVYIGALDHRFDWEAIVQMAEAAPWAPFLLAGPIVGTKAPKLPENVRLLGPLPYDRVPDLLRSATVGLLPLTRVAMNNGRSPMKYYEYLAAGLRVVATETPTLVALRAPGVALYRSHADASSLICQQLSLTVPNEGGTEFARRQDWSDRARRLSSFLETLLSETSTRVAD